MTLMQIAIKKSEEIDINYTPENHIQKIHTAHYISVVQQKQRDKTAISMF